MEYVFGGCLSDQCKMGLITSREQTMLDGPVASTKSHHVRQPSTRNRTKPPMPDRDELESRFIKVLASMDLPPDKAKLLRNYDLEKKWEIICDQDMVQAKDSPAHYLNKLRTYLDPKASRSHRKRKMVGDSTSTQVLRDLEISLRTNHIEWVREFLNEQNQGLDVLIDYLSFRLSMMRHEQRIALARSQSTDGINQANTTTSECSAPGEHGGTLGSSWRRRARSADGEPEPAGSPAAARRRSRHAARLNMGASTDDIHVCIMCMRAIMNNKYGFNMVIQHREAINSIALSLVHQSLRTKALVLELLAAICLVKGGHQIILGAFDNFKVVAGEPRRFHTLMEYFMNYDSFHIEFMLEHRLAPPAGGVHAVREHNRALRRGHELPRAPAVRVHGAQAGRLPGEAALLRERGLAGARVRFHHIFERYHIVPPYCYIFIPSCCFGLLEI